jgi:hypothetical protein
MKHYLLTKIRLTHWYFITVIFYVPVIYLFPKAELAGAQLTLFSVNSFLYGFYISPILSAQKSRIEELHKVVREESNAIFSMALHLRGLPKQQRHHILQMIREYLEVIVNKGSQVQADKEYEDMITYSLEYKGEHSAEIDKLLESLIANERNRTNFNFHMNNKVYSNEWAIMTVLFSITLGFILVIDPGDKPVFLLIGALLCTGLTMLLIILVKMSTLTHKKAKQMYEPYKTLLKSNFYRID